MIAISDSIILSMPAPEGSDSIIKFRHFCIAIGLLQNHLAMRDIWLRGAVTKGQVAHRPDETFILGPAYIDSYELEQKCAKQPRVILDNSLIKNHGFETAQDFIDAVNEGINFENWKGNILYDWVKAKHYGVKLNQDVPLFIDYLEKCFMPPTDNNYQKCIVENICANMKMKTNVYEKFRWVADYYLTKFRMVPTGSFDESAHDLLQRI